MQRNKKIKFKIKGMTCLACKEIIEKEILKLDGVIFAKVKLENNSAEIEFIPEKVSVLNLKEEVESLNYSVIDIIDNVNDEKTKTDTVQIIGTVIIAVIVYFVVNSTIGFNFIPDITDKMGFGMLFLVGFFASLHCISMCGGINLSQCMPKKEGDSRVIPSIMYNLGRVISYTILGGIVGGLGSVVSFSNSTKGLIEIIAGVFMLIMGLNMLNVFPFLRKITPKMPMFIRKIVNSKKQGKGPFVVGLLNGFIPCGPLQAMQLYALGTGSIIMGALSMFFFSLGTVPLMFGLVALGAFLGSKFTQKMIKVSGALVIILGIIMAGRGLALSGHHISLSDNNTQPKKTQNIPNNESSYVPQIKDGKQVVVSNLTEGRYQPITVKKGIPVKWTINAKSEEINRCNNVLIIPKYNIEKELVPGENVIEFTADEEGIIPYSCSMGMIRSKITVEKNDDGKSTEKSFTN